jgi:multiple sugar transport system substrate-binding protein
MTQFRKTGRMRSSSSQFALACLIAFVCSACSTWVGCGRMPASSDAEDRSSGDVEATSRPPREVLFWHFWGGEDQQVVDRIVERFNSSQNEFRVRAVAMPGNNIDLKLFLAIAGGDPPDLVNQDDPIVADWAHRGAIIPIDELATNEEMRMVKKQLLPAALRLGQYDDRLYALCNGLDIRALYYNKTLLDEHGLRPPETLDDLDRIATTIAPPGRLRYTRVGYLPDSRRLWAWGAVFGGDFYDEAASQPTLNDPAIVDALEWMASYRKRYGADAVQAFRQGDQSLPGSAFPLLPYSDASPHGRYAVIMDGQWRTRDISSSAVERKSRGLPVAEFGVCPLPPPAGGLKDAGWVNGNFFLCPRGSRNPQGAWAFMKFWCGLDGHQAEAAKACSEGGWIPVSNAVVEQDEFQQFLKRNPLFREFVRLASSKNQSPTPLAPAASLFDREVRLAGGRSLSADDAPSATTLLNGANDRLRRRLREVLDD